MKTERDTTRIVRSWLEMGADRLPDRVLDSVLDQLPAHRQRHRPLWWPRREFHMNALAKTAIATAAVLVVAVIGYNMLPGSGPGSGPSPSPTASPAPFHNGPLTAGRYVMTPFSGSSNASTVCMPGMPACSEDPADDSIRVTLTLPDGYEGAGQRPLIWGPDGDTGVIILRGAFLYTDPCHSNAPPDIAVGPTVDDFANAIADHPVLDATTPVDVTLAGFSGKYIDLRLPADITGCTDELFWPYEPGVYAQGNDHRWHLWILDVDGVRVVVQSMDYPTTSEQQRAELQAIVDSIHIEP